MCDRRRRISPSVKLMRPLPGLLRRSPPSPISRRAPAWPGRCAGTKRRSGAPDSGPGRSHSWRSGSTSRSPTATRPPRSAPRRSCRRRPSWNHRLGHVRINRGGRRSCASPARLYRPVIVTLAMSMGRSYAVGMPTVRPHNGEVGCSPRIQVSRSRTPRSQPASSSWRTTAMDAGRRRVHGVRKVEFLQAADRVVADLSDDVVGAGAVVAGADETGRGCRCLWANRRLRRAPPPGPLVICSRCRRSFSTRYVPLHDAPLDGRGCVREDFR